MCPTRTFVYHTWVSEATRNSRAKSEKKKGKICLRATTYYIHGTLYTMTSACLARFVQRYEDAAKGARDGFTVSCGFQGRTW